MIYDNKPNPNNHGYIKDEELNEFKDYLDELSSAKKEYEDYVNKKWEKNKWENFQEKEETLNSLKQYLEHKSQMLNSSNRENKVGAKVNTILQILDKNVDECYEQLHKRLDTHFTEMLIVNSCIYDLPLIKKINNFSILHRLIQENTQLCKTSLQHFLMFSTFLNLHKSLFAKYLENFGKNGQKIPALDINEFSAYLLLIESSIPAQQEEKQKLALDFLTTLTLKSTPIDAAQLVKHYLLSENKFKNLAKSYLEALLPQYKCALGANALELNLNKNLQTKLLNQLSPEQLKAMESEFKGTTFLLANNSQGVVGLDYESLLYTAQKNDLLFTYQDLKSHIKKIQSLADPKKMWDHISLACTQECAQKLIIGIELRAIGHVGDAALSRIQALSHRALIDDATPNAPSSRTSLEHKPSFKL